MKHLTLIILTSLALVLPAHARSPEPIINFENVSITPASGKMPGFSQVKAAIEQAAKAPIPSASGQQWEIAETAPGQIVATLHVRGKHMVRVDILYNVEKFSVTYRDSMNMNYSSEGKSTDAPFVNNGNALNGKAVIHPYYNRWVKALVDNIRLETRKF